MDLGANKRQGDNMGNIEVYNHDGLGGWTNLENVEFIETINCQLCNEPTQCSDIFANLYIKDAQIIIGSWQCRKCHAVNG
jgi:hypothetical protein